MYNSINPINIVYRKPQGAQRNQNGGQIDTDLKNGGQNYGGEISKTPDALDQKQKEGNQFPNGAKVAIDYSKNKINISQVIIDFKSTILAINAPKEISDEVAAYLALVEKESLKSAPSREIIVSNLKNASRISDDYIAKTLGKPSKVVEGWVDALFLQSIVLKADPLQVNPDFKVNLPERVEQKSVQMVETIEEETKPEPPSIPQREQIVEEVKIPEGNISSAVLTPPTRIEATLSETTSVQEKTYLSPAHKEFMEVFSVGKKLAKENNPKDALVAFAGALDAAQKTGNIDFKGATHLERGKIFDRYDYVNFALGEYNEATKCNDSNIKTHAHLKMAKIYDDYVKFEPALKHYHCAVSFSGSNPAGQTRALKGIATMYAERYDKNKAETFNNLAAEVAQTTENSKIIGRTYREIANDYGYLGENKKALTFLKESTVAFSSLSSNKNETKEQIAKNYFEAAKLMKSLGNEAKANKLLTKAYQYRAESLLSGSFETQSA